MDDLKLERMPAMRIIRSAEVIRFTSAQTREALLDYARKRGLPLDGDDSRWMLTTDPTRAGTSRGSFLRLIRSEIQDLPPDSDPAKKP